MVENNNIGERINPTPLNPTSNGGTSNESLTSVDTKSSVVDKQIISNEGTANTGVSENDDKKSEVKEEAITTYEEALAFGLRELGKERRKDGHQIDLKVIGHTDYKVGEWVHVYLPSYNEDCFMFIIKSSSEAGADSEFITSLTLVDYPPSLGSGKMNSQSNDDSSESTDSSATDTSTNEATTDTTNNDTNTNTNNDNTNTTTGGVNI